VLLVRGSGRRKWRVGRVEKVQRQKSRRGQRRRRVRRHDSNCGRGQKAWTVKGV